MLEPITKEELKLIKVISNPFGIDSYYGHDANHRFTIKFHHCMKSDILEWYNEVMYHVTNETNVDFKSLKKNFGNMIGCFPVCYTLDDKGITLELAYDYWPDKDELKNWINWWVES